MPKVVSIHTYRGGTGKSNFTANLATTLAQQGNRVAVVDTDIPSPGVHNILGLEPEIMNRTLNNYLWGDSPIEDAGYDVNANVGLKVAGDRTGTSRYPEQSGFWLLAHCGKSL